MAKYIDAEKVIAALTDTLQYEGMVMDELISVVANIPAADVVERKTGKWISDSDDDPVVIEDGFPDKSCYCSECREWLVASDEYAVKGNFCPNCGADMRGEGHE